MGGFKIVKVLKEDYVRFCDLKRHLNNGIDWLVGVEDRLKDRVAKNMLKKAIEELAKAEEELILIMSRKK